MDIQQKLTAMSDQLADVVEQLTKLNVSNVGEQLAKLNESNAAIGRVLGVESSAIEPDGSSGRREAPFVDPERSFNVPTTKKRSARHLDLDKSYGGASASAPSAKKRGVEESEDSQRTVRAIPVAPDGVEKRVLTPKNILTAREEFVNQLVDFGHVTTNVLADAFAICSKPCNNVGCDQPHVSEDCPLEFMCRGCGQMGHVAQDCVEQCDRCGKWGHVYGRCTAKDKPGMPDPPAQLMPLLRPSWASERVVLPLVDRLMAEARLQASEV